MSASATIEKRRIEIAPGRMLSDIDILSLISESNGTTPVVIVVDALGNRARAITRLCRLSGVEIYFRAGSACCTTDAQILSSLGINTGIVFSPASPLPDSHTDLLTYQFYSPSPHADIEPWATMARARAEGKYLTPRVSLSGDDPGAEPDADGLYRWQQIMVEGGECAFCPAMRLCEGFFSTRADLADCKALMTEAASCIDFSTKNIICRQ